MKEVKLTKKEQALLATFKRPYSVNEIVSKIDVITQNLLKYMYEDISAGADLVQEKTTQVIPAQDREVKVTYIIPGAGKNGEHIYHDSKEIEHEPEHERTEPDHFIDWLRFNSGIAMVGLVIDGVHYIHKKFYDSFKDKSGISLEKYTYMNDKYGRRFEGDDFPREKMKDYEEFDRVGDWVICARGGYDLNREKYLSNQKPNFKGYDRWVN